MSNRGTILLAIGMLVLGLILGGVGGGVAGFFMGQNRVRTAFGQFNNPVPGYPPMMPGNQPTNPFGNQPGNQPTNPFGNNQPGNPPTVPGNQPTNPFGNQPGGRFQQNVVNGARVVDVEANSAAAQAGLQVGDVITAVGGTTIDQNHQIADLIKTRKPGDKVDLSVTRGTQTLTLTVTLAASPSDSSAAYLGIRYAPAMQPQGNQRRFQ